MSVIAQCAGCGQKNRLGTTTTARCARCKRPFTPNEVMRAALGERPGVIMKANTLEDAALDSDNMTTHACNNDEDCGWEGHADELVDDRCPECGKRVHPVGDEEEEDDDE